MPTETTTPTPSPEAEALPTLPVVAWTAQGRDGLPKFGAGWIFAKTRGEKANMPLAAQAPAEAAIVALRAEVERLTKERDAATQRVAVLEDRWLRAPDERDALRAEVAELRKDAERYRTLRRSLSGKAGCSHTAMPAVTAPFNSMLTYTPASFDAVLGEIFSARGSLLGDGGNAVSLRTLLRRLAWDARISWRLDNQHLRPFHGAPDEVVERWAALDPNSVRRYQLHTGILMARDEVSQRQCRWRLCDRSEA